jgi:hypothetical protein
LAVVGQRIGATTRSAAWPTLPRGMILSRSLARQKCNFVDEDCDGKDYCPPDADVDGFSPPADCDDHDAKRNPRALEIACNGIDDDCNGYDACDRDDDGRPGVHDCNDANAAVYPGASEKTCDGIDQDCDGADCCDNELDRDGFPCRADCNDRDARTFPGAPIPSGCLGFEVNCDGVIDGYCR